MKCIVFSSIMLSDGYIGRAGYWYLGIGGGLASSCSFLGA